MATVNLISPWVEHYRKIDTFFKYDPDVNVVYDDKAKVIRLYVSDGEKAGALDAMLPDEVTFGSISLGIDVIPANGVTLEIPRSIQSKAFTNNPIVKDIISINDIMTTPIIYVVFVKEVVQYYNDDLGDYFGMRSTLYEEIAREIFSPAKGVNYCTAIE